MPPNAATATAIAVVVLFVLFTSSSSTSAGPANPDPDGKRLIQFSPDDPPVWMTPTQVEEHLIGRNLVHFMDITDYPEQPQIHHRKSTIEFPSQLSQQELVAISTARISNARLKSFIDEFSGSFNNRYYNGDSGRQSSEWLHSRVQSIIDEAYAKGYAGNISVRAVPHAGWLQNSLIARIEGADPGLKSQILVLGAHQDSIHMLLKGNGLAPGADDDASGCAVLVETLRILLEPNAPTLQRAVEFHWYAAEEAGLRGSQEIAQDYNARGVDVVNMMQMDVVGYFSGRSEIGVVTDFTNEESTQFLRGIIDEYCSYKWKNFKCGYGCSDHASWNRAGYTTSMPVEIQLHPLMHTSRDDGNGVNYGQLHQFARLALAHTIELGLPTPPPSPTLK